LPTSPSFVDPHLFCSGPFDALIEFPQGVDVIFQGANIANIILPPICSPGGASVPDLETTGILQITDLGAFTSFTAYLLNNPSFTWTITTDALRVYALGE
jgi:alpha-D-ribose 1-methylphosphonate 5-triphosphate synthase subunit PhnH